MHYRKMLSAAFITVALVCISCQASLFADTIIVPDDYLYIQDAIDAADYGTVISVKEGVYDEGPILLPEGVRIIGEGRDKITVNGKIHMGADSSLEGITFNYDMPGYERDSSFNYSTLHINSSNVSVIDCTFNLVHNGTTRGYNYTSVASVTGENITLEGNDFNFRSSRGSFFMYGIRLGVQGQSSNITLRGNRLNIENTSTSSTYHTHSIYSYRTDNLTFENNIINTRSKMARVGLYGITSNGGNVLVKNNTIYLKTDYLHPYFLYGIFSIDTPRIDIRNNIIQLPDGNRAYNDPRAASIYVYTNPQDSDISFAYNLHDGTVFKYPSTLTVSEYNNLCVSPVFTDLAGGDFHLLSLSPAIADWLSPRYFWYIP